MSTPDSLTSPLPIDDPLERAILGEDINPVDIAEYIVQEPANYSKAVEELYINDDAIAGQRDFNVRHGYDPDYGTELLSANAERLKSTLEIIDPAVPDPMPIAEALPHPDSPEGKEARFQENLARQGLDKKIKELRNHLRPLNDPGAPEYSDPDDPDARPTDYELWAAARRNHLSDIDDILRVYPNLSGMVMGRAVDNQAIIAGHPERLSTAAAAHREALGAYSELDTTNGITRVDEQKIQFEARNKAYDDTEAKRHAAVEKKMLDSFELAIMGDGETETGLRYLDRHVGEDPRTAYAAEVTTAEASRKLDHQMVMHALYRWHESGDPRAEAAAIKPLLTMQEHLKAIDDELAEINYRHSRYETLRESRDKLYNTIIQARFTKERVRIETTPRGGKDALGHLVDTNGRPFATYTVDKGIHIRDIIIHADGSYQRVARDGTPGDRYAADGVKLQNPRPAGLGELPNAEAVAADTRNTSTLTTDVRRLSAQAFANSGNARLAANTRATAYILRSKLENTLPSIVIEPMPNPADFAKMTAAEQADLIDRRQKQTDSLNNTRREINALAYEMHYLEAGRGRSPDRVMPNGMVVTNETLNGERARWAINPDGSATKWGKDPATGKAVPVARYDAFGNRTA